MTIFGAGDQTRSFCYVDDLIDGFRRMMDSPEEFAGPVNMGNPHEFTMLELAKVVARHAGSEGRIEHRTLPTDDPLQRKPDITLARKALGWEEERRLPEPV